jgi:hypothetical protein
MHTGAQQADAIKERRTDITIIIVFVMIKYLKYLLFVLFISVCHIANGQVKLSDLPRHTGSQNNVWLYSADSSSIWNTRRISLKEIRDSIIAGDSGLKVEHDPIWEAISLPDITTLPTFPFGANKQAIVKDSRIGGVFHLLAKGTRTIDSAITYPSPDTSQVWVRDRSQSTAINAAWYLKADYNTATGIGTDNKPYFLKMLAAATAGRSGNVEIHVPAGQYYFSDSIGFKQTVKIVGDGLQTIFWFAAGKNGFVFNSTTTPPGTTNSGGADNSDIGYFTMNQKAPIIGGHAIIEHCAVKVHDIGFNDWGGCAVYINAGAIDPSGYNKIWQVFINDRGDLFDGTPTITATSPTGSGATFTPVLSSSLSLSQPPIANGGRDYYRRPGTRIGNYGDLITEDNIEANGYDGTGLAVMGIDTLYFPNGGTGYTPGSTTITIAGGTITATATPIISSGKVVGATVTNRGEGFEDYTEAAVTVTGTGTGATGFAVLKVIRVDIINNGALYEGSPQVRFFGGGRNTARFQAASGTITLGSGGKRLKRIIVNNRGDGYKTSTTTINIIGGSPQGNLPKASIEVFGDRLGNANRWLCKKLFIDQCMTGIWTEGGDANAGHAEECKITSCRWWGVQEKSFLGNSYSNCHTQSNLGAYMAKSNTGIQTIFYNCYGEADQLPSVGVNPARLYGGDHGEGVVGGWKQPISTYSSAVSPNGSTDIPIVSTLNTETITLGGNINVGEVLSTTNSVLGSDLKATWSVVPGSGTLIYNYGGDQSENVGFRVTGPWTSATFGTSKIKPYSFYAERLNVGEDLDNARLLTNANGAPPVGEYAAGTFVINRHPNNVNKVVGWSKLLDGSGSVLGVDWLAIVSGAGNTSSNSIWNQDTAWQNARYFIAGDGGSKISNDTNSSWLTIPKSGLDIVTKPQDGFYAAMNIYSSGSTNGMHLSSTGSNVGTVSVGGWSVSPTTYMPRVSKMTAFREVGGEFLWLNGIGLTAGVETSLVQTMKLDSAGRLAIGTFNPTATLHLKAGSVAAGTFPLKFQQASSNLTGLEIGGMNFVNGAVTFDVSAVARKKFVLTNNVVPTNGQIPIGDNTGYFTLATLTPGSGINVTNSSGGITISSPLANGRFGIEDNTSTVARDVNMQVHNFTIRNVNFGINTTNPTAQLQVGNPQIVSTFGNPRFAVQDFMYTANSSGTQNGGYLTFSASNDVQGQMYGYFSGRTARGTVMTPAVLQTGDTLLKVGAAQWRPDGWPSYNTAAMNIINDSLATPSSAPTYIGFSTTAVGSIINAERLRLKANGGIRFNAYGSGTFTGTATKWLAVTATGDMIEMVPPTTGGGGSVTSVGLSMPSAFGVAGSPVTASGTFSVTMGGATTQYLRGNGTLSTFSTDARTAISLTTTGTGGAATYNNSTGILNIPQYTGGGSGTVTSAAISMPAAFNVSGSPITTSGTFNITGAGTTSQYIRGDGTLATLPTIPAQFNPTAGTGISLSGSYPNVTISSKMLVASTTRDDLPDLAPGAFYDFAETVTGAAALDGVIVASTYTTNIQITGQVSATNTVTVRVTNQGSSTIGFSTNWPFKIYVMKE